MYFKDIPKLISMLFNFKVLKLALFCNSFFCRDKSYNMFNLVKASLNCLKGERIVKHEGKYIITSFLPPIPSNAFYSVVTGVRELERGFYDQSRAIRKGPISLFLSLTQRCNFKCKHCSQTKETEVERSTGDWKNIITSAQNSGVSIIGFTGGEPTLRGDLEELISHVDSRSISILYTNGFTLNPKMLKSLKESGLWAIGISLDSDNEEKHNNFRGVNGSFQKALKALNHSASIGLYTIAQTVIQKGDINKGYIKNLAELAYNNGAKELRILEPIPSGEYLNCGEEIIYSNEDRSNLISVQRLLQKSLKIKITTFAHTESPGMYGCGAGSQHSYINNKGDLFPCDFVPMDFGNCVDTDFGELWRELNDTIGPPKQKCFAMALQKEFYRADQLPLSKVESIKICNSNLEKIYPKFYQLMMGNE